jgi:hypothetical protein
MYELQYVPLALPFFRFLVGLFLFIVVLIQVHVAYAKLGLSSGAALLLLLASLIGSYFEALKLRTVGAWLIGPSRSHECGGEYEKDPYTHRQIAAYPRIHRIDLFS